MMAHESDEFMWSENKKLFYRVRELEQENAVLKDDIKALNGGLDADIREQRDQYRRERDDARSMCDYLNATLNVWTRALWVPHDLAETYRVDGE